MTGGWRGGVGDVKEESNFRGRETFFDDRLKKMFFFCNNMYIIIIQNKSRNIY